MAIDPKELRVGAHVDCKGSRYEVCGILGDRIALIVKRHPLKGCETASFASDFISPIPITEELLTELGFELNEDWNKCLRGSKRLENLDGFIQFKKLDSEFDNLWEMIVGVENGRYQLTQCLFVRYIHEAEQFLYLTTKQELIND